MSEIDVRIRFQFAAVPRELAQNLNVSANVLAVITYLCSKGESWRPRVYDIQKRFDFGDRVWRQVSKEMRALGILDSKKTRGGTALIFDPHGVGVDAKVIHKPPVHFSTVPKATRAFCADIDHIDPNSYRSFKNHDHNDLKKPPMRERKGALGHDAAYLYEKLLAFGGIFPGVALAIVEQYTAGEINNVLEMARREDVRNPGKYVVKSLYKKQTG